MHRGLAKCSRCAPVVFWCALLLNSPLASSQGNAGGTVSPSADLTGDGIREVIETAPDLNADAGAVDVFDGATGNLIVRFVGPAGSRFGWSCVTVPDLNGDGLAELLIGAPGAQRAYLAFGPFVDVADTEVDAARLNLVLEPPPGMSVVDFGFDVGGLHDLDGDTLPDLRVAAMELAPSGQQRSVTLVFQGVTGALVGIGRRAAAAHTLETAPGDADKDVTVGGTDMTRVIETLGTATDGGAVEGDVTLDGAVDGADIAMVVEEWGTQLYLEVVPDLGACGDETYRIEAWGESVCVEVIATSTLAAELTVAVGQAAEIDPLEVIHPLDNDCGDSIKCCLEEQDIKIAVQLVVERCWPSVAPNRVIGHIYCSPCTAEEEARTSGFTRVHCDNTGVKRVDITICARSSKFCQTLAHELVHLSQACSAGLFARDDCGPFWQVWRDPRSEICTELEAYALETDCGAGPPTECCAWACESASRSWRLDQIACIHCCYQLFGEGCCDGGLLVPNCSGAATGWCAGGSSNAP